MSDYRNDLAIVALSGGVGGARLARGLNAACTDLTVVVNVGDDEVIYGLFFNDTAATELYALCLAAGLPAASCAAARCAAAS